MKALVKTKPKPGIEFKEVEEPSVGVNQVLVEVKAAGICGSDVHIYEWTPSYEWVPLPLIIGHEFSGRVVKVGANVKIFQEGDRITCNPAMPCGTCPQCQAGRINICERMQGAIGLTINGAFAQYVLIPEGIAGLYQLPKNMTYETAALTEPLCVALHAVDVSQIRFGDSAVVLGPGPIGLLTVQALKTAGIAHILVTGLSSDKGRLDIAEGLGADVTINVEEEDPVRRVREITHGRGADAIFEATGNPTVLSQAVQMVKRGGEIIVIGIFPGPSNLHFTNIVRNEIQLKGSYAHVSSTWNRALILLSTGKVETEPLITHRLPLDKGVEGFELEKEKKAIKVIFIP